MTPFPPLNGGHERRGMIQTAGKKVKQMNKHVVLGVDFGERIAFAQSPPYVS